MYCPKCGNKLPDGVSTCENCGWSEDAGIQLTEPEQWTLLAMG